MANQRIKTDFLVIGSGLAGLNFASKVSYYGDVIVLTKKSRTDANTNYAQGGIAAVFGKDDSFENHIEDTLKVGEGISDKKAVTVMVKEGPRLVRELIDLGVRFSMKMGENGKAHLDLWKEGGHSRRRILHAQDLTGREIERAMLAHIREKPNVRILENFIVIDLIIEDKKCFGAYALDTQTMEIVSFISPITMLATGGGGQVYLHTTNPGIATGDGIAMAFLGGARVANLEFVQFHPTTLFSRNPMERNILISEAVRGEGGILVDKKGERFMENHPLKELAPRDIIARTIDRILKETGDECVFLDIRHMGETKIKDKFPNIYRDCLEQGVDITSEPIPVVPAAHYLCGGVKTDLWGKTDIDGLYAAGETSYTGVHGANRLASNSLLEALVFSSRAAKAAGDMVAGQISGVKIPPYSKEAAEYKIEEVVISHIRREIKQVMWDYVGIVRSEERLKKALKRFKIIVEDVEEILSKEKITREQIEIRNLAYLGLLTTFSALQRKESRGLHYNKDYPEKLASYQKPTILQREEVWNTI